MIGELLGFCRDRLTALLGEETAIEIRGLILERTRAIDEALTALRLQYPDFTRELQSRYLGRIARQMESDRYDEWKERAIVGGEVAEALAHDRDQRWADLDKQGRLDVALSAAELVERVPLFAKLTPDKRAAIARLLKSRMTLPGEPIVRRGQRGDAMYFIASGAAAGADPRQAGGTGQRRILRRTRAADRPAAQRGRGVARLLPPAGAELAATSCSCWRATPN